MTIRTLQILRDLIAIPSVNPMRAGVMEPVERGVADYLESLFRGEGIDCERQPVSENRENLIAVVEANFSEESGLRPGLMFNSHMDTVPVENMSIDPFDPAIKNGRVYGRGACDAKGSLAAMAEAFIDYASSTVRPSKLVFAATVDEEFSFSGACRLIEKQLPVEACIVGEPTKLSGIIAHKGVARWRVIISGISAHGATPQLGRSAIYDGARVALALEAYADELNKRVPHSLLGHGVINVGRVNGGQSVNVVPDACTFEIERRLLPGEDAREAIFDCEKWVRERVGGQVEIVFENPYVTGVPLETKIDSAIVQTVVQAQRDHLGELLETAGAHYCTDGGRFSEAGIETIVCGPGDIALAHTREEFIEIEQLELATGLYRKVISKWAEREQIGKQRMMVL